MTFTEKTLERAIVELFKAEQIPHFHGDTIHKEMSEVLPLPQRENEKLLKTEIGNQ